jgi:hypothetical protein
MSSSFWEFLWLILSSFFLLAYLMVLFQIVADLFRDRSMGGIAKALWIIALIFVPMLTALIYIILRGAGMGSRQAARVEQMQAEADDYIRDVARTSPADQIARANSLLREGTITEQEFQALKAKALAA